MLKLKLPYFSHLMRRADSFEKTLILGKIEGRRRRGWQRMRWLDGITDSMDMNLSKLREMIKDREAGVLPSMGGKKSDTTEWLNNKRSSRELPLSFSSPCESTVSAVTCQLGSELLPEPHHAGVLISHFQPPRLWDSLWYFVVVASADLNTCLRPFFGLVVCFFFVCLFLFLNFILFLNFT